MKTIPFLLKSCLATVSACGLFAWSTTAGMGQATPPVFVLDPTELINDYVSIGEFATNGVADGWVAQNQVAPFVIQDGVLKSRSIGSDPHFLRSSFPGTLPEHKIVEARVRVLEGARGWQMYWGGVGQSGFSGAAGRFLGGYTVQQDDEWHVWHFDFTDATLLTNRLTHFRLDPGDAAGTVFEVDYVRVGRILPDGDGDGVPDLFETGTGVFVDQRNTGTKPAVADSDGDGFTDGEEIQAGSNPNDRTQSPIPTITRYTSSAPIYIVAQAIEPNAPAVRNGTPTAFQISPSLPPGLIFNRTTGEISGTPTTVSAAADYTITATFGGGKTAASVVNIAVSNPFIHFGLAKRTLTVNEAFAAFAPAIVGGTAKSFTISPSLPAGLTLDPVTGEMAGPATAFSPLRDYTVTASFQGFPSATATFAMSVLESPAFDLDPKFPLIDFVSIGEFNDPAESLTVFAPNALAPLRLEAGALVVETTGGDPQLARNVGEFPDDRVLEFRMKVLANANLSTFEIYFWEVARGPTRIVLPAALPWPTAAEDLQYHTYRIDLRAATEGPLTTVRLDPGSGAGNTVHLDYIRLGTFDPRLQASWLSDGRLRLSWAAAATGYQLESASALPGGWSSVSPAPTVEGDRNVVALAVAGNSPRFFRLRK